MNKTYRYDSKRAAQKAWPVGKGTWFDGHDAANLWIVTGSEIYEDPSNSMWAAEVTFRAGTADEFLPARLRWLRNQLSSALSTCSYDNPQPGRLEIESRAEVKALESEIVILEAHSGA